jgi:pyruvate dehydrogenase E2 component (dihydrolipoamide acetyltransferase)
MSTQVYMPALGMAQESGTLVRWLKTEGDAVREGDALAEIQTDKATVELEARASGMLAGIVAREGEDIPVGQVIATILAPDERPAAPVPALAPATSAAPVTGGVSPLARRIAEERGVDPTTIPTNGRRLQKSDVLAYLADHPAPALAVTLTPVGRPARLAPASPKARRLARERGVDLARVMGSGPGSAVRAEDVLAVAARSAAVATGAAPVAELVAPVTPAPAGSSAASSVPSGLHPVWRIMAERTAQSWREIPHFFLLREINASRLIAWREQARRQQVADAAHITYTDLLVVGVARTLRTHPRVNASWREGGIIQHDEVNIALAVAADYGLVTPVIHRADTLALDAIAARRTELVARAQSGKQRPDDLAGATFTISNLGMYGVDAFNAIVPAPQAAILAVGRIVERVVPVHGAPAVQPMLALSLSCDHRVIDGARGAEFLGALADLLEEPLALLR